MKTLDKILPNDPLKRKWTAIGITIFLATLLTLWGIYQVEAYGMALFILTPLFIGLSSTILYGYKRLLTRKEATYISFLTLGFFALALILFAIEGLVCIAMAAPIGTLFTWIGGLIGRAIVNKGPHNSFTTVNFLFILIPIVAFIEKNQEADIKPVSTHVLIDASPETVWKNVIAFPQLEEPTEFIFRAGIAYPIAATIEGEGVGAVRHCTFNTGSFVEPITIWEKPRLLAFDVLEQPAPLKELSFWDIDAPHLHDYFVSQNGQFKLTELPNGQTKLAGTTWYYHDIKPDFYWRIWSNWIIHSIHRRVLTHIKMNAEREEKLTLY